MSAGAMTGRCLCGAVRVTVDGAHVAEAGICHCRMCQRWGGGVYADFRASNEAVTVTGEVARYASSAFAERAFCPVCGSHLWFRLTGEADAYYGLMPGLFEGAAGFAVKDESYVDLAPSYGRMAGSHPKETGAEFEARSEHFEGDGA